MTMHPLLIPYYLVKPLIPRSLQIWGRRQLARKALAANRATWPIHDGSGEKPASWPGWPKSRKFALVLVHDVETRIGYDRCQALLEIERDLGFVSSFNFVPERYEVKTELIRSIKDRGFEVGVHGLNHDGMLFLSNRIFQRKAIKINRFLDTWDAVGFYAPSMLFDPDKIKRLNRSTINRRSTLILSNPALQAYTRSSRSTSQVRLQGKDISSFLTPSRRTIPCSSSSRKRALTGGRKSLIGSSATA